MNADYWTLLGLCSGVVGAFLVSVEAIKLRNLKRLRERLLGPAHKRVLPVRIVVGEATISFPNGESVSEVITVFVLIHFVGGLFGLLGSLWVITALGYSMRWAQSAASSSQLMLW